MVVCGVILFAGINAVSITITATSPDNGGSDEDIQTAAELDGTTFASLGNSWGTDETVYDSRGYAVELTGAPDSYIQSTDDISTDTTGDWTVSVWVDADQTTTNHTAVSVDGNIELVYNGSTDTYTAWYYNQATRNSYDVAAGSTASPGDLENVVLVRDRGTLTIYVNDTASGSVDTTADTITPAPTGTSNWDGRLEELRVDATPWDGSTISNHYNDPIGPLETNHEARIMFDEPYRNQQRMFYNSGEVSTSNATFVSGIPGQKLDSANGMFSSGSYRWEKDGPAIRAVDGKHLDGAPVAYVDYVKRNSIGPLRQSFSSAITLAGLLIILLPLGVILSKMYFFNQRR